MGRRTTSAKSAVVQHGMGRHASGAKSAVMQHWNIRQAGVGGSSPARQGGGELTFFSRLVAVAASHYARPRRGQGSRGGNPSRACPTASRSTIFATIAATAAISITAIIDIVAIIAHH